MAADYAALEARVADLENQMRNIIVHKVDAVAYAVSLVHEDVRATRDAVEGHGARFDALDRALDEVLRELRRR
jgi:hypothetical protein